MHEFKERLVEFSKTQTLRSGKCTNEEMTKQFLVLPFLNFLGYDIYDPEEVVPEFRADFSEKYQNKVDYAIFREGTPIIAIEVKSKGKKVEDDKGQLKSYFNALKSVKLGILTDGGQYECYTDTDEPNMMDDTPFLAFDLSRIVNSEVSEITLKGIINLNKVYFNPENIGTEARSKFLVSSFINLLEKWSEDPSDKLIRLFLDESNIVNKRTTTRIVDENRRIVREAMEGFIKSRILSKLGVNGNDLPKLENNNIVPLAIQNSEEKDSNGIITTQNELDVFDYCRRRLAFLVKEEELFMEINNIEWRDYKTRFCVFYKKERAGSLFYLQEKREGNVFIFPALENREIIPQSLAELDQAILESFTKRVKDMIRKTI